MHAVRDRTGHVLGCAWFWVWALVGFGFAISAVSLGPLVMAPIVLVGIGMTISERARPSAFGLLTGIGALCLLVAALQRGGESLDARPWVLVGLVLAAVGIAGHAWRRD